jgi:hypothetical protein
MHGQQKLGTLSLMNMFTSKLECICLNKRGQPGAHSSHLRKVRGRVRPLWVLCTQHFPAFLGLEPMTSWVTRQIGMYMLNLTKLGGAKCLELFISYYQAKLIIQQ